MTVVVEDDLLVHLLELHLALTSHSEELLRTSYRPVEGLDLVECVVQRERCPHRGLHTEATVQGPRAVMADAHRDAVVVEHLAHVVGVDTVHHERHRPTAVDGVGGPDDPDPGNPTEGVECGRGQLLLVAGDGLHPHGFEVAHRGCETDRLGHHGDPGLGTLRRVRVGRGLHGHRGDHRTAGEHRRHGGEKLTTAVEDADPG